MSRTQIVIVCAVFLVLSGCSVIKALRGPWAPDFTSLKTGVSRNTVEKVLGKPVTRSAAQPGLVADIYEYEVGRPRSLLRASGHLLKDIFTLGFWEYWAEQNRLEVGHKHRIRVVYDEKDTVREMRAVEDIFYDQDLF